jgi:AcrR family transcriptional regulator
MSEKTEDRRTRKTKKAICDAFAELLTEKELHRITVKEIIDKADISRVTFYNHYLDIYDLNDKFEENIMLDAALLVLDLEEVPYEDFFSHLTGYVTDNRTAFKMMFSPNGTNKLRFKFCALLEGLLRQLYLEDRSLTESNANIDYMIRYRAQGIVSVLETWVQDDLREPAAVIAQIMAVLDGSIEDQFTDWMQKHG